MKKSLLTDISVSIIIISKNRPKLLRQTVSRIQDLRKKINSLEIIVVEEKAQPKPIEGVHYRYIPPYNRGFGYARNKGLGMATGEITIFLDDDVRPSDNWLEEILSPFKEDTVGAVGGAVLPEPSNLGIIGKCIAFLGFPAGGLSRLLKFRNEIQITPLISTGNCAFRTQLAKKLGGFDELMRWGGEDQDFFKRLSSYSKTVYNPNAIVYHRQRESLWKVFLWFIRRGKAEFYRRCKNHNCFSAYFLPYRSNFFLKLAIYFLLCLLLAVINPWLSFIGILLTSFLWHLVIIKNRTHEIKNLPDNQWCQEILKLRKMLLSLKIKNCSPLVKFVMDLGHEIGKFIGLLRYLRNRIFFKPFILTFHQLGNIPKQTLDSIPIYYFSVNHFTNMIEKLIKKEYFFISLPELINRLKSYPSSLFFEKLVVITFDDGYLELYGILKKMLTNYQISFTVFVPTQYVGKMNKWEQSNDFPEEKIMDWKHIKELSSLGGEFGSHTQHHVKIPQIDIELQKREIEHSLRDLKKNIGDHQKSFVFSYPYGAYQEKVTIPLIQKAGYVGAVANFDGNIRPQSDLYQLPRYSVFRNTSLDSILNRIHSLWIKDLLRDIRDKLSDIT